MSKMPSFIEYVQDVFNPKGFFDTIYDRSEEGLKEKSREEIEALYTSFQKDTNVVPLPYTSGTQPFDFAEGVNNMIRFGKSILPYTRQLFEKFGTDRVENKSLLTMISNRIDGNDLRKYVYEVVKHR